MRIITWDRKGRHSYLATHTLHHAGDRLGLLGSQSTTALVSAATSAMAAAAQQLGSQLTAACAEDKATVERCAAAAQSAVRAAQERAQAAKAANGGEAGAPTKGATEPAPVAAQ